MTTHDAAAGLGFGAAAGEYAAGRPDYPADAVAWLLGDAQDVVDVGAGTGKLTGVIASLRGSAGGSPGRRVTAVEPDAGMLDVLRREVPDAVALTGTAEAIPLPDDSADAVVLGQAWHWVDVPRASAEAARVLRPGGVLGLVWNVRDTSVDWVRELGTIMRGSDAEGLIESDAVRVAPPFGQLDRREWPWTRPMTVDRVVAMAASRSYVIALDPPERAAVLHAVRAHLEQHPATRGRASVELPYTTVAFRTTPIATGALTG